jgi:2'-5' RNA ligase
MTAPIHSLWLMPSVEDGALLAGVLADLSARFGTPLFTPHLTIAGDTDRPVTQLATEIAAAAAEVAAFSEAVTGIETSETFFRSFYARFAVSAPLASLKQRLDPLAREPFLPHVSLLYGPVPAGPKAEAAAQVSTALTNRPIRFDRLCVVTSGQDVPIADWRIVETVMLG